MRFPAILALTLLVGCSSTSEEPTMTLEQAKAGYAGTYAGPLAGGATGTVELALVLTATVTPKCGTHTLSVKCVDVNVVRVQGTITTNDGAFSKTAVEGTVTAYGNNADNGGDLSLHTTAGDTITGNIRGHVASATVKLTGGKTFTFDAPRK